MYSEVDHLCFCELSCSGELHARAHTLALSTAKESACFHTKINSHFSLLSILWSQTGHVKQYFSQISFFPFLEAKIYSTKMQ